MKVISMLAERGGLPWSLAVTTTQYSDLSALSYLGEEMFHVRVLRLV